jgi:hypothetical protein
MLTQGFTHQDWLAEQGATEEFPAIPFFQPDETGKPQETRRRMCANGCGFWPMDDGQTGLICYFQPQTTKEAQYWVREYWETRKFLAKQKVEQAQKNLFAYPMDDAYCAQALDALQKCVDEFHFAKEQSAALCPPVPPAPASLPPDDALTKRLARLRQQCEEILRSEPGKNGNGKKIKVPVDWLVGSVGPGQAMKLMGIPEETPEG